MFYKKTGDKKVVCELCPHFCKLKNGQQGICHVRKNVDGILYSLVYGRAIALHIDPIEKKPLFHVAPGSSSFSMATAGCNFQCKFCQNHDISQVKRSEDIENFGQIVTPEQIVGMAEQNNCQSIAYTYTEPTIYYEYAYETAKFAHEKKILNVFVTNGYINSDPLKNISPLLDAANIDLKSFNNDFYRTLVGAKLSPVLETLKLMKELNIWVEVTTLIIPGMNDSPNELNQLANFIKTEMGEETPWHISRFYPQHELTDIPPTSNGTLEQALEIGNKNELRYVYVGNVPGNRAENTVCYNCKKIVIKRRSYQIVEYHIDAGKCEYCGAVLDGIQM